MELIKKSERMNWNEAKKTYRRIGIVINELDTYKKWKQTSDGGRMTVRMTLWKVDMTAIGDKTYYILSDTLDRRATEFIEDKKEILNWLKEKGYKEYEDFMVDEYGADVIYSE